MTARQLSLASCYELLDVDPSASQEEIKAAYRQLAYRYHPDRNPGNWEAESRLKEVITAYGRVCERRKWECPSEQAERSTPPSSALSRPGRSRGNDHNPDSGMYSHFIYAMTGNHSLR